MAYTVVLEGGSPWGFRLEGGAEFNEPLKIAKGSPINIVVVLFVA